MFRLEPGKSRAEQALHNRENEGRKAKQQDNQRADGAMNSRYRGGNGLKDNFPKTR